MIELSLVKNLTSVDISIHFHFEEVSLHSMDAIIFNECERQFINALKNANKYLKEPLDIQVFAKEEGGLIENIKILIKHPMTVGIIVAIITSFCTAFFTAKFSQKLPLPQEVKTKLENVLAIKEAIASDLLTEEDFVYIASNDKELQKMKSNFFKTAKKDKTLRKIDIETDTQVGGQFVFEKITVPYEKFDDFILKDDENEDTTDIDEYEARIYIIAPILIKGRKDHWKGFYNGESIEFTVSDNDFLELVYSHEVKFGSGTYLDCKLRITSIVNIGKDKQQVTRDVIVVNNYGDDENFVKPVKRKPRKSENEGQGVLNF